MEDLSRSIHVAAWVCTGAALLISGHDTAAGWCFFVAIMITIGG